MAPNFRMAYSVSNHNDAIQDDPIAVKDIRDLRFMAEIFRRQDRCAELFSLWDNPPTSLKKLMKTHRDDLISLKTRLLKQQNDWLLLENHCYDSIEEVISQLNLVQDSKSLWELCAWRWDLWSALLQATEAIRHGQQWVSAFDYYNIHADRIGDVTRYLM